MKTVACRIPVGFVGFRYAFGDHLLGSVIIIRLFFFLPFAFHANGDVIING